MSCLAIGITECKGRQEYLYCSKHYQQIKRYGEVKVSNRDKRPAVIEGDIAKIPLGINAKDGYAIVDAEFAYLADDNWNKTFYGYARRSKDKQPLHRVITGAQKGEVVDHINGNELDNRTTNIRICTPAENAKNSRLKKNNKSGYKGVYQDKRTGNYVSRVKKDYISYSAGIYKTAIEAGRAYDQLAKKLHGEFARLNNV